MWYPYIPKSERGTPPQGPDWGAGARRDECDQHTQTCDSTKANTHKQYGKWATLNHAVSYDDYCGNMILLSS